MLSSRMFVRLVALMMCGRLQAEVGGSDESKHCHRFEARSGGWVHPKSFPAWMMNCAMGWCKAQRIQTLHRLGINRPSTEMAVDPSYRLILGFVTLEDF